MSPSSCAGSCLKLMSLASLRTLLATAWLLSSSQIGHAIDTANFHVVGFSKTARWFAFTEFVVLDASGLPYVRTHILDTQQNQWAAGTPIDIKLKDQSMIAAHDRAQTLAAPKLKQLGIKYPGRLLVGNPMGESRTEAREVVFKPGHNAPEIRLTTKSYPAITQIDCKGAEPVGLVLIGQHKGDAPVELYRDRSKQLPSLRRCATGYSIAAVYGAPEVTSSKAVVLLYVSSPGFEGEDNFLIAVSVALPNSD